MKKTNVKIKPFLKVILIIAVVLIFAAVAAASTYYVMRRNGTNGANVKTLYIGDNGNWFIGDVDTGVKAEGKDGADGETPYIGENGNWFIGDVDTGVKAEGKDGADGLTPYIGDNGNWFVGDVDTGVKAEGKDGADGTSLNLGCVASGSGVFGKGSDGNTCCIGYAQYFRTGAGRGYLNLSISLFNSTGADWYRYIDLSLISSVIEINLNQPSSLPRGRATGYWTPINTKADLVEASRYGATCVYNEKNYICLARIYTTGFNVGAWGLSFLDANDDEWSTYTLTGIEVEEV